MLLISLYYSAGRCRPQPQRPISQRLPPTAVYFIYELLGVVIRRDTHCGDDTEAIKRRISLVMETAWPWAMDGFREIVPPKMERQCLFTLLILGMLFFNGTFYFEVAEGANPSGMFVFGDSYVDTGNHNKMMISWQPPYGITFPGKPSGRFSDGRVLADFVASFFNISTPVPYNQRSYHPNSVSLGMNFAFGGTGVQVGPPNVTAQIDQFQRLIGQGLYSARQLSSYLVLLSVSGNDYGSYLRQNGANKGDGVDGFAGSVVKQISVDLRRLYSMGARRFAVTGMGPLGCLPSFTFQNSYKHCSDNINKVAVYHNLLLEEAVNEIRKSRADARLVILDQYTSSMSILQHPNQHGAESLPCRVICDSILCRPQTIPWKVNMRIHEWLDLDCAGEFKEPLKPCCTGPCGGKDGEGKALYGVCANPSSAFFWDVVHPTQAAWHALMADFGPSLHTFQN